MLILFSSSSSAFWICDCSKLKWIVSFTPGGTLNRVGAGAGEWAGVGQGNTSGEVGTDGILLLVEVEADEGVIVNV